MSVQSGTSVHVPADQPKGKKALLDAHGLSGSVIQANDYTVSKYLDKIIDQEARAHRNIFPDGRAEAAISAKRVAIKRIYEDSHLNHLWSESKVKRSVTEAALSSIWLHRKAHLDASGVFGERTSRKRLRATESETERTIATVETSLSAPLADVHHTATSHSDTSKGEDDDNGAGNDNDSDRIEDDEDVDMSREDSPVDNEHEIFERQRAIAASAAVSIIRILHSVGSMVPEYPTEERDNIIYELERTTSMFMTVGLAVKAVRSLLGAVDHARAAMEGFRTEVEELVTRFMPDGRRAETVNHFCAGFRIASRDLEDRVGWAADQIGKIVAQAK